MRRSAKEHIAAFGSVDILGVLRPVHGATIDADDRSASTINLWLGILSILLSFDFVSSDFNHWHRPISGPVLPFHSAHSIHELRYYGAH